MTAAGLEPTTFGSGIQCSTNWAMQPGLGGGNIFRYIKLQHSTSHAQGWLHHLHFIKLDDHKTYRQPAFHQHPWLWNSADAPKLRQNGMNGDGVDIIAVDTIFYFYLVESFEKEKLNQIKFGWTQTSTISIPTWTLSTKNFRKSWGEFDKYKGHTRAALTYNWSWSKS